jgi:ubiquitin-protein ligase E3 B
VITEFETHNLLKHSLELLCVPQDLRIVFNALEGSYALCLIANLIHLAHIQRDTMLKEVAYPLFTVSFLEFKKYIYNLGV